MIDGYFDGTALHADGPYSIELCEGVVQAVEGGDLREEEAYQASSEMDTIIGAFAMPGFVEGHGQVFGDPHRDDQAGALDHHDEVAEALVELASEHLARSLQAGITTVRDTAERPGASAAIFQSVRNAPGPVSRLISGRRAVCTGCSCLACMAAFQSNTELGQVIQLSADQVDEVKVVLTDLSGLSMSCTHSVPQLNAKQLRKIVFAAHDAGLGVTVHCSGAEAIDVAVAAQVDVIEHGWFVRRDQLARMAEQRIAWIPTLTPLLECWECSVAQTRLRGKSAAYRERLDRHMEQVAFGSELGVEIIAGSAAGEPGLIPGAALINELVLLRRAGLPLDRVLAAATSVPHRNWGIPGGAIKVGYPSDVVVFSRSPLDDICHIEKCQAVIQRSGVHCRQ